MLIMHSSTAQHSLAAGAVRKAAIKYVQWAVILCRPIRVIQVVQVPFQPQADSIAIVIRSNLEPEISKLFQ